MVRIRRSLGRFVGSWNVDVDRVEQDRHQAVATECFDGGLIGGLGDPFVGVELVASPCCTSCGALGRVVWSISDRDRFTGSLAVVIRNVVMVELKPGWDAAEVSDIQEEFRGLDCAGTLSYTIGSDLSLREGNWSFAIVADFVDVDAYRAYDHDDAHNAARDRLAPLAQRIARVQFEVPDTSG